MYIKNLEIKDFRNYNNIKAEFHERVNIIMGKNAQGKTNLLEAIYMTSLGKSFRTSKDSEMIEFGKDYAKIKVTAQKDEDLIVEIIITREGKGIKIDGVKAKKNSDLLENIYVVAFTPEDLKIVKEEPEKRRKFIDREICQIKPGYYNALQNYKKVLLQRNSYLKERQIDEKILDIWDEKLAEYGSKIIIYRDEFIDKLKIISKELHKGITDGKEDLNISYEANIKIFPSLREEEENFISCLKKSRENDFYLHTTTKGPHKDDLKISVNGIDIRHFGSQGQQRTAALSLKLSEIKLIEEETSEKAVLLLDDVLSELDSQRQSFLISSLSNVQLFISTTELPQEVEKALPNGKKFIIDKGTISEKIER